MLLGLGAAAKFYPVVPRDPAVRPGAARPRARPGGPRRCGGRSGTWLAVNLPFAIAAPARVDRSSSASTANAAADFDSLWYIACRHVDREPASPIRGGQRRVASCRSSRASRSCWWAKASGPRRLQPLDARRSRSWSCFLLANKVYSPQYGLWLLPLVRARAARASGCSSPSRSPTSRCSSRGSGSSAPTPASRGAGRRRGSRSPCWSRVAVLVWCVVLWVRSVDEPLAAADGERAGARGVRPRTGDGGRAGVTRRRGCATGVRDALVVVPRRPDRAVRDLRRSASACSPLPPDQPTSVPGWPARGPRRRRWTAMLSRPPSARTRCGSCGSRPTGTAPTTAARRSSPCTRSRSARSRGSRGRAARRRAARLEPRASSARWWCCTRSRGSSSGAAHARRTLFLVAAVPDRVLPPRALHRVAVPALSVLAFWFARRDRWALAALAGARRGRSRGASGCPDPRPRGRGRPAVAARGPGSRCPGSRRPRPSRSGPLLYFGWWAAGARRPLGAARRPADLAARGHRRPVGDGVACGASWRGSYRTVVGRSTCSSWPSRSPGMVLAARHVRRDLHGVRGRRRCCSRSCSRSPAARSCRCPGSWRSCSPSAWGWSLAAARDRPPEAAVDRRLAAGYGGRSPCCSSAGGTSSERPTGASGDPEPANR